MSLLTNFLFPYCHIHCQTAVQAPILYHQPTQVVGVCTIYSMVLTCQQPYVYSHLHNTDSAQPYWTYEHGIFSAQPKVVTASHCMASMHNLASIATSRII